MGMTVQDLRDFVRNFLDTDAIDLPDPLLDVFRREATTRVLRASQKWRFLQTEQTLTTVVNQASYDLGLLSKPMERVTGVQGSTYALQERPHEMARGYWGLAPSSSNPNVYSVYDGSIWLWPPPSSVTQYVLTGFRKPLDVTAAGDSPDLPDDFHPIVARFMLASAYAQQDDQYASQVHEQIAENKLDEVRKPYEAVQGGGVMVLGGHEPSSCYPLSRPLFDFEV